MIINKYGFGYIVVNGKKYTKDVIIYRNKVDDSWWRLEGHELNIEDLGDIVRVKPEILVVGTGKYGAMKVPDDTIKFLEERGIKVIVCRTDEACKIFNQLKDKHHVVAALHLTC